ncbi:putative ribonuclease H-like domain-containing protein [Tanacetum coccineum]
MGCIVNGDLEEEPALIGETSAPPAPKTAKQLAVRRNLNAKSLWEAIKSRFGGNIESKKMQKNVLKHQKISTRSSLEVFLLHGIKICLIIEIAEIVELDTDDLYNNLRVYKDELKRSSGSNSASQNLAFLSSKNTSSTNEFSTVSGDFGVSADGGINQVPSTPCAYDVAYSFLAQQTTSPQLENEDFQQMDGDDLEELDLRWQVAMLTVKALVAQMGLGVMTGAYDLNVEPVNFCFDGNLLFKLIKSGRNQGKISYGDNGKSNAPTNKSSSQALVAQDGLGGYDWSNDFEIKPVNYALMIISSSSSSSSSDNEGYELALELLEFRILVHEKNELTWGEKYEFQNYELKYREIRINNLNIELEKVVKERDELKLKIEKWEESSNNLDELLNSQMSARDQTGLGYGTQLNEMSNNSETDSEISLSVFDVRSSDEESTPANDRFSKADGYHAVPPSITGNFLTPRADISFAGKTNEANTQKPKTVYESVNKDKVIIEDWNSDDEDDQNEKRAVHKVSTARTVSTARPVSTVRPFAPKIAQTSGAIRPIYPRMDNVRPRGSYSPIKRSYYTKPAFRPKDLKQDVKTFGVQNMTTAGTRAVVNTGKGKMDTDLKKSRWVWRPKGNYLDHVSKDSGSFMLKKVEYVDPKEISKSVMAWVPKGNPEILLQDHAVVDSSCSSHMTGNKAYLSNYEDYNGGFMAFGSDPKGDKILGKGKIKTANLDFDDVYFVDELKFNLFFVLQMCDKKNRVLFTETECLILSPSFKLLDESQVVLRDPKKDDVYNLDLKNIVPSGGITYSYANATADESKLWHRRLGHVNFKNTNKLVKGHLVRGLPSKVFVNDHTCVACKKGKQHKASCLENQLNHNVKIIRCDNGTEFKNHAMNEIMC